MGRAAHLEHGDAATHLAVELDVAQQDDRVSNRRDVAFGDRSTAQQRWAGRGEQPRDLTRLEKGRQFDHELAKTARRRYSLESRNAVHRDPRGLDLLDV